MKNSQHVNLLICTPGSHLTNHYVSCLLITLEKLGRKGISATWANNHSSHVGDAREITLSGTRVNDPSENRPLMGEITYDKMIWIDSDIIWDPEDVLKLYESDKDIICGGYLMSDGSVMVMPKLFDEPLSIKDALDMTEPVQVEGAGFGFICIKQGIFESMSRPWFQSVPATVVFKDVEYTFPIMGEDLSWCHRARSMGYEIWYDPSVKVTHYKPMRLTWEGPRA